MKTYIFDLDETLYPATSMSGQHRVHDHTMKVKNELNLQSYEEAQAKSTELYKEHGTTFAGLTKLTGITFEKFYDFSKTFDYSEFHEEDHELEELIKSLKGKKYIYSAGHRDHVLKTLKALNISSDIFDGIFATDDGDVMQPKPQKKTQDIFVEKYNIDKDSVIYFDDSLSCIKSAVEDGWNECILINHGKKLNVPYTQAPTVKDYLKSL